MLFNSTCIAVSAVLGDYALSMKATTALSSAMLKVASIGDFLIAAVAPT